MRRSAPALSTLRTSCRNRRRHSAGAATGEGGGSAGKRKQQRGSSVCNVGRRRCSISRRGSGPPAAACEGVDVLIRRAAEQLTSLLFTRRPRLWTSSSTRHPQQRQLPASALPPQEVPTRTRPRARRRQASRCPAPADTGELYHDLGADSIAHGDPERPTKRLVATLHRRSGISSGAGAPAPEGRMDPVLRASDEFLRVRPSTGFRSRRGEPVRQCRLLRHNGERELEEDR